MKSASTARTAHDQGFEQRFERRQRALPADVDHLVVAPPPRALLEAGLHDVHARRAAASACSVTSSAIGPIGSPSGGSQNASATKKPCAGSTLHDGAPEHAAEPAEDVVAEIGRRPLDRVGAEQRGVVTECADLPPRVQRIGVEERFHDAAGGAAMTAVTSSLAGAIRYYNLRP